MAEENQQKKKSGIVKRILKWIGLGLLTLLLLAALFFQAPWKVTALLVIFLLAHTVLPKPAIKWFWLSVGIVVIALVVWVFLPDKTEGWRVYKFDEELAALEAKYAVPDEENAAVIYEQLFAAEANEADETEANFMADGRYDLIRNEPWLSEDHPEIAAWLQSKEDTIGKLMEACRLEKCQFAISADMIGLDEHMVILSKMRRWTDLPIIAGNNDIAGGQVNEALEKYRAALQMAKHQYQQPTLVDLLVGIASETRALRQFNRFVVEGDAMEANLNGIEALVSELRFDWSSDLKSIIEWERLMAKNLLGMLYEINTNGKVRLSRNLTAALEDSLPADVPLPAYWERKLIKALTILSWFYMPSTPQEAGEIIDARYERYYEMAKPDFDWASESERKSSKFKLNYSYLIEHLVGMSGEVYYRIHDLYLRLIGNKRGSQLLIALRRYKNETSHWPGSLDDVKSLAPAEIFVDPTNNDSFVYKLTEENFTLYSKGKNNIDDGGEKDEEAGADDILIWPPKNCKAQEENADVEQQ